MLCTKMIKVKKYTQIILKTLIAQIKNIGIPLNIRPCIHSIHEYSLNIYLLLRYYHVLSHILVSRIKGMLQCVKYKSKTEHLKVGSKI